MMKSNKFMNYFLPLLFVSVLFIPVLVESDWQLRRLMEPTHEELIREKEGEVVIYDQLTDKQVDDAMSAYPERIRNMMFIGTIVTDEQGDAHVDDYGMFQMEDGGC
jgi:hypothetical protein